jgi:hypothetical protein
LREEGEEKKEIKLFTSQNRKGSLTPGPLERKKKSEQIATTERA